LIFEGLLTAVRELLLGGVNVDYIETNAFWAHEDGAIDRLRALMSAGVETLCISIDPYHAEYVPYGYPLRLAQLCDKAGMGHFLWRQELLPLLSALSPEQTYDHVTLKQKIGADYVLKTARAYGIHFGGRAINIEEDFVERKDPQSLIDRKPCRNLLSGNHFHVDMECFYIPPGCTGLRLPLAEVVNGIPEGNYPVFEALYHRGLAGLLDLAHDAGFVEDDARKTSLQNAGYTSKCAMCFHVRRHLAVQGFAGLDLNHYEEALH
jgi:hypothetical protein